MQPASRSKALAAAFTWTSVCLVAGGCQQPGAVGNQVSPITTLPNQSAAMNAPDLSALNPFALGGQGGARVAPPATGSYGKPGGVLATPQYAPQSYAPAGSASTSWNLSPSTQPLDRNVVPAGYADAAPPPPAMPGQAFNGTAFRDTSPTSQPGNASEWRETGTRASAGTSPTNPSTQAPWRAGGMGVIDLTNAPPPPGYVSAGSQPTTNPQPANRYPVTNSSATGPLQSAPAPVLRPLQPSNQSSGWTSVPGPQVRGF